MVRVTVERGDARRRPRQKRRGHVALRPLLVDEDVAAGDVQAWSSVELSPDLCGAVAQEVVSEDGSRCRIEPAVGGAVARKRRDDLRGSLGKPSDREVRNEELAVEVLRGRGVRVRVVAQDAARAE